MATDLGEIVRERLAEKARHGQRPTQADLLWLDATREHATPASSVEASRNAKGDMQFTVKVAHPDPLMAELVCKEIVDRMRRTFPMANGTVGSPAVVDEVDAARKKKP